MNRLKELRQYSDVRDIVTKSLYRYIYQHFDMNDQVKLAEQTTSWVALSDLLTLTLIDAKLAKSRAFVPLDAPKIDAKKHKGKIVKGNKR